MNYMIDAFNLGFKLPSAVPFLRRGDTEQAIKIILRFLQNKFSTREKVVAVFDGQQGIFPGFSGFHPIEIKFSKAPQKADDIIRNFLRKTKNAGAWTVITSDHEIINTAKAMGANFMTSESFISMRLSPAKQQIKNKNEYEQKYNADHIDMDYWLKQFGKDKE